MQWTRQKRYLPYNAWPKNVLKKLQQQVRQSNYRLGYHIQPTSGLLNDPNGFSFFNHQWHIFYQSYPFGAVHGLKSWVHLVSKDLIHWDNLGVTLKPDTHYDSHGAFSGSAYPIQNRLFLMYTGNVRDTSWKRHAFQNGAWLNQNNQIKKLPAPLILKPEHVTDNFRDPQIIFLSNTYYALIGAQDKKTMHGEISLFSSLDARDWHEISYLKFSAHCMGYMIECPNLVFVDSQPILIFCPQGLDKKITLYDNIYPNVYIIGNSIDFETAELHTSQEYPINFDDGFDIYATQAFTAPNGQTYAISWVGLPEIEYPTDKENWAHCLSQVKKLSIKNGKLIQEPIEAIASIICHEETLHGHCQPQIPCPLVLSAGVHFELKLDLPPNQSGNLFLAATKNLFNYLKLSFKTDEKAQLIVDRENAGIPFAADYGTTRRITLPINQALYLDIFVDNSLCEIFVNHGEHVLTLRFFTQPDTDSQNIIMVSETNFSYNGIYQTLEDINHH